MGEKKRRLQVYRSRVTPIVDYVNQYLSALKALVSSLPDMSAVPDAPELIPIGHTEVWPCSNAAVVLFYSSKTFDFDVIVHPPLFRSAQEFFRSSIENALYDNQGNIAPIRFNFDSDNISETVFQYAGVKLVHESGHTFSLRYAKCMVIGWNANLTDPSLDALEDFRKAFETKNILGKQTAEDATIPLQEKEILSQKKANEILNEFQRLLESATLEEELQVFIRNHPEILYPDYIECHPKLKLGSDYVTDFVFLIHGDQGLEYVFVELERANKDIFTKSGQFSSDFTQAKDQLLDWDRWVNKHNSYIKEKLIDLYLPIFRLVFGRIQNMSTEKREKIRTEFVGTNRRFSTYDDVADRFALITKRLH